MPGVPAVLLEEVEQQPPPAGPATVRPGRVDQLVEPAVGQGRVEPDAGPGDGAVPERVQLLGCVVGGGLELPVVAAVPAGGLPRLAHRRAAELHGERVVLHRGEVLEQPAQRQRGGADRVRPARPRRGRRPCSGRSRAGGRARRRGARPRCRRWAAPTGDRRWSCPHRRTHCRHPVSGTNRTLRRGDHRSGGGGRATVTTGGTSAARRRVMVLANRRDTCICDTPTSAAISVWVISR